MRGLEVVVCQLGQMGFVRSRVELLQRLGNAEVQAYALSSAQPSVKRLPHQLVRKTKSARRGGGQQARLNRLIQNVKKIIRTVTTDASHDFCPELGAQHGAIRQRPHGRLAEVPHSPGYHLSNAGRQGQPQAIGGRRLVQVALRRKQAHGLADEQRVAIRLVP